MDHTCDFPGVKIKSLSARQAGARGIVLTLPKVWTDDLGLRPGDRLDVFRDTEDRLIIVPQKKGESEAKQKVGA